MSSADWWARKLGQQQAQQQQPRPQQYAPAPSYPQTGPTPPPAPLPQGAQQEIVVTKDNILEAAAQWKGGKAMRTETSHCPDCGSANYFSNANGESLGGAGSRVFTQGGAMPVAPRCFECGYTTAHGKQTGAMG